MSAEAVSTAPAVVPAVVQKRVNHSEEAGLSRELWAFRVGDLSFRVHSSTTLSSAGHIPFVLLPGIGMSHRYLQRLHDVFSETNPVVTIDLPGFGGVPKPARSVDIPEMARAIGRVLDSLGVEQAVLVGHSMGTQWAVELAVQRPELVTHVVAVNPVTDDERRSLIAQAFALAVDTIGEPVSGNLLVVSDYLRCGQRLFFIQARHMLDYRIEHRVKELEAPLLILRGERDPIAGLQWCRRLRGSARPGTLLVNVPGHRHLVQRTAPRAVASAVRAFMRRRPSALALSD